MESIHGWRTIGEDEKTLPIPEESGRASPEAQGLPYRLEIFAERSWKAAMWVSQKKDSATVRALTTALRWTIRV